MASGPVAIVFVALLNREKPLLSDRFDVRIVKMKTTEETGSFHRFIVIFN
jgi:hypothetical protein